MAEQSLRERRALGRAVGNQGMRAALEEDIKEADPVIRELRGR